MPTAMIVDDSATARAHVCRALTAAGFDVVEACDGLDALAKLAGAAVDVMVCDVNMPGMDGIELVEELARSAASRLPVIMTEARPELVRRARAAGARAWLTKPFDRDALVAAARTLAARAR